MKKRYLNIFLAILLFCSVIFLGSPKSASAATEETQTAAVTQGAIEGPERLSEVVGLRTKNSKTYKLTDGTYEWVGFTEDIHYNDADGKLKEINNAITDKPAKEGYTYSNTANSWHTYFADSLCEKDAVVLEEGKYNLSFNMADAQVKSKVAKSNTLDKSKSEFDKTLADDNRAVVYKDVLKDVDVAYTVRTSGLKEEIILRTASAPNVFEFDVTLEGLSILEKEDMVFFVNSEGQDVFRLAPVYMIDANGKYSDKVECIIEKHERGYRITVTTDKDFLNAPDTQYPVIVDPSYDRMITGTTVTHDSCVDQQYPNSNYYLSENLWTGGLLGTNAMRTFIKFDLPTDIPFLSVTSAYLRIKKNAYADPTIKAYMVSEDWTSSTVNWTNQPDYSDICSGTAYNDSGYWYRMDATSIVQIYWLRGISNYGFCLKEPAEADTDQKTRFYSSDAPSPNKPELHIEYTIMDANVKIACDGIYRTAAGGNWASIASTALETADDTFNSEFGIDFNAASVVSWTSPLDECSEKPDCDASHGYYGFEHRDPYVMVQDALYDLGMGTADILVCITKPASLRYTDPDSWVIKIYFGMANCVNGNECIIVHDAVNMLSWQEMRHEISHIYGADDHDTHTHCIMYFDDEADELPYPYEWCPVCWYAISSNRDQY